MAIWHTAPPREEAYERINNLLTAKNRDVERDFWKEFAVFTAFLGLAFLEEMRAG